jgi:hypothetical protein
MCSLRMYYLSAQTLPLCKIILITPPPVGEDELRKANVIKGKKIPLDRTNARYYILLISGHSILFFNLLGIV